MSRDTGLDTVGLAFPIEADFDREGARPVGGRVATVGTSPDAPVVIERARWAHELPGGGFVNLGLGMAWCEASIPKRIDPDGSNVQAVDVATVLEVAREMVAEAERVCAWDERRTAKDVRHAKVVRADHVRDFDDVHHVGYVLDGLAAVPRADKRWKARRWQDSARNAAETLRVGPRAWGGTLYDKHAESPTHAPAGRVRYEARLHKDQMESRFALHNAGITRIIGKATNALRYRSVSVSRRAYRDKGRTRAPS